jgi:gamma-D-glutamyl-L-lysine dipeptidyl-peptidase
MIAQCVTAYAQLRAEARHSAELVSQLIQGECVRIIREEGPWDRVQTEDGYEGFTRSEQLAIISEHPSSFQSLHRLQVTRTGKNDSAQPILQSEGSLILSCDSLAESVKDPQYTVLSSPLPFNAGMMAQHAMNLLTIPYVWGGKTAFGFDCSGLVQFLFHKQGFSFPRDAWQQAENGREIVFDHSKPEFEEGDLLFFQHPAKKVHHVAISIGGSQYIHASEWVRINSLNEHDSNFQKERRDTFVYAKRTQSETLISLLDSFRKL